MMSRPTDKPMARAQAHLAAGRLAEAIGAFRAVLGIDPSFVAARLGLADAQAARGQRSLAVEGLVEAAERCVEEEQHEPALLLYGRALAIEPSRTELHLDLAVVERAMGREHAAIARIEVLAERCMAMGRTDEAADLLRFIASWEENGEELEPEPVDEPELEEATVIARNPLLAAPRAPKPAPRVPPPSTETVVCATVLVRPDGSLWLGGEASPGASEFDEAALTVARAVSAPIVLDEFEEVDPDMETRVSASPSLGFESEKTIARADAALLEASRTVIERRRSAASARANGPAATPKVVVAARPSAAQSPASSADARTRVVRTPRPAVAQPARTEARPAQSTAASRPQPPASARPATPPPRPAAQPSAAQGSSRPATPPPLRPAAQTSAAQGSSRAATPPPSRSAAVQGSSRPATPPPLRPAAPPSAAQAFARPASPPVSRPAAFEPAASTVASGPLVDRLRKRAGIGPEAAAVPHSTKGLGTEPIVIRRPNLGPRPERDEEATHPRFRHRGAVHPASY